MKINNKKSINKLIEILKEEYLYKTSLTNEEIVIIKNYLISNNYIHKIIIKKNYGFIMSHFTTIITYNENLLYLKNYVENINDFTNIKRNIKYNFGDNLIIFD
jgi:hypothetical protein